MPAATNIVYDGFTSLLGGMNAAVAPWLVPDGMAANLVNAACRTGEVSNRPAFAATALTFDTPNSQIAFTTGNFQGAGYYACPNDVERIIAAVAGRIYRMTPITTGGFYVEDFTPPGDAGNNPDLDRVYMCQSDIWFIVQDGQSPAILIQQNVTRRAAVLNNEIPIGTFMAYGFGRTWVCTGGNSYMASDLLGELYENSSYNAVVRFTDGTYLAENSEFSLPSKFGPVTGMSFYDQQDTATGQGPLMVFGTNGAESVNVSLPRTSWQTSQIQVEALTNIGSLGDRSIVNVNGDLFFRSYDGWRSYRQARGQQGLWGQLPMSTGVRPYTDAEYPPQLGYGSAIFFNNRLIVTSQPQKCNLYTVHAGLLSLDFDVISSTIGVSTSPPAWDGFWTTPRPVAQLLTGSFGGILRAFAFTTNLTFNADGSIQTVSNGLSEIIAGQTFDDAGTPITTTIETRALTCSAGFSNQPNPVFREKELIFAELFQVNRKGPTSLQMFYRQNGNTVYNPLTLQHANETTPGSPTISGNTFTDAPPLFTVENRCDKPMLNGNAANTRLNERFYEVQFKIVSTGSQTIRRLRIKARVKDENERSGAT